MYAKIDFEGSPEKERRKRFKEWKEVNIGRKLAIHRISKNCPKGETNQSIYQSQE